MNTKYTAIKSHYSHLFLKNVERIHIWRITLRIRIVRIEVWGLLVVWRVVWWVVWWVVWGVVLRIVLRVVWGIIGVEVRLLIIWARVREVAVHILKWVKASLGNIQVTIIVAIIDWLLCRIVILLLWMVIVLDRLGRLLNIHHCIDFRSTFFRNSVYSRVIPI